ncbi:proprotein convertase P-domain-containing protein [Moritella sp. 5]|uniref:PKD domain-containing protein n=1 Tax=Moritella sp. 5 TaxID=2746231 RepID=UPI001BAC8554|nr:proprotein convertase P-domain-containing protein [Moritella sp. 5]QUM80564.1 proprotein convertase P-domain-containing protein [Moritella sp. 5]
MGLSKKKTAIATALSLILSVPSYAELATNTTHNDFRSSVKLDVNPIQQTNKSAYTNGLPIRQQDIAFQYLKDNKKRYQIESIINSLKLTSTKSSLISKHFYFKQFVNDIPVESSTIIVSINKNNQITRVYNNTYPVFKKSNIHSKKNISADMAIKTAWEFLQASGILHIKPTSQLTYLNMGTTFQLSYKVNISVSNPQGDWEFNINAKDNSVINVTRIDLPINKNANSNSNNGKWSPFPINKQHKALDDALAELHQDNKSNTYNVISTSINAQALVFSSNPIIDLKDNTIEDNSSENRFSSAYVTRSLNEVSLINGHYHLSGPWVKIVDWDAPNTEPSTTENGSWTAKRGDNAFNDAMTYYHIDQSQRYIQSLGYSGKKGIQFNSIAVDTNGAKGADNSYFSPGTNRLSFGHGGVDDNEDSDVILHEYGHAINKSINDQWYGGDTGAMGEGFGDYWANSYRYSTTNGRTFKPEKVFSWDGISWGGRRSDRTTFSYDPTKTYPAHTGVNGQNGDELWSTPLTQAHLELLDLGIPRSEIDTIILESQFGLGQGLTMPDLANSIVSTAQKLFPSKAHARVFFKHFSQVNILEAMKAKPVIILSSGNDVTAEPGETVNIQIPLNNKSPATLSGIIGSLSSSSNIDINQPSSRYPDLIANSIDNNLKNYQFTIPHNHICGAGIPLTLSAQYQYNNSPRTHNFSFLIPTGKPGNLVSQQSTPNKAIPDNDNSGINDQLTLTNSAPNSSISVEVNISHPYSGDITLLLTSPHGTQVKLKARKPGDYSANIQGNYPLTLTPVESLSVFRGEDTNGTWTLNVADVDSIGTGELISWKIISSAFSCKMPPNQPPVINIPDLNISIHEKENVVLDASNSTDPENSVLTFNWTQVSGPDVVLINADKAKTNFIAPDVSASTELIFEIKVSDPQNSASTERMTVKVMPKLIEPNQPPVINIPNLNISTRESENVVLDASNSTDPEHGVLTFNWTQISGPDVVLINADKARANFIVPEISKAAELIFEIVVSDSKSATSIEEVTVKVNNINSIPPQSVKLEENTSGGSVGIFSILTIGLLTLFRRIK